MSATRPLEITGLSKAFGEYVAVENFNLTVNPGEFVCLLGHSGCGKSTVLSILAGLQQATRGGYCIDGKETDEPGLERGVVFQSPSLLPWLTAAENVTLALGQRSGLTGDLKAKAKEYLGLTGVADAHDRMPGDLSLGMRQRVSIARALALEPRFLLLDEPFGMLDSLTRFELQDMLLELWESHRKTVVMVTHDVDEALYLSDRIVLMTDGPAARVGEIINVPFGRPRDRATVLDHPGYAPARDRVIDFLERHTRQFTH